VAIIARRRPFPRSGRGIGRVAAWLVVLVAAFGVGVGAGHGLARAFNASEVTDAVAQWIAGLGAAFFAWRHFSVALQRRAAARIASTRAAGEELRRTDRLRYDELLGGAWESLALTDPDLYVGRKLSMRPPREQTAAPGWVQFSAFIACAVLMFVVFPLVFAIRSLVDAAVAVPLFAVWVWFSLFGAKRGWWEIGGD
jgi:hypothetical protein